MKRRNMVLALGMVAFCMAASLFAADDPFNGTWKLNVAKSKYVPGPGPQSLTTTVKVEGDTHNVKSEGKTSDGTTIETSFGSSGNARTNVPSRCLAFWRPTTHGISR